MILLLIIVAIIIVLYMVVLSRKQNQKNRPGTKPDTKPASLIEVATPQKKSSNADHIPPQPSGRRVQAWGKGEHVIEVVGEAFRPNSFNNIFRGHSLTTENGQELTTDATLVNDDKNPYDHNAVAIFIGHNHVGYLDRDEASRWTRIVKGFADQNQVLQVRARVWAANRSGRIVARVTLYLPDKSNIKPTNPLPTNPYVVLPSGQTIQVTKEEEHMHVIRPFIRPIDTPIAVTLHKVQEQTPRTTKEIVEVRLNDLRVGVLTPTTSTNVMPLLDFLTEHNYTAVARATLKSNQLKADITLQIARVGEVPQHWFNEIKSYGNN